MQRDASKWLYDILDAGRFIVELTGSVVWDEFLKNRMMRDAVERNFIIIGEAMNRLRKDHPKIAAAIPEHPQIVAFRNIVVHAYDTVDAAVVWQIATERLPELIDAAERLLGDEA